MLSEHTNVFLKEHSMHPKTSNSINWEFAVAQNFNEIWARSVPFKEMFVESNNGPDVYKWNLRKRTIVK